MNKATLKLPLFAILVVFSACSSTQGNVPNDMQESNKDKGAKESPAYTGQVYLYGEVHGKKKIKEREFEIWNSYYQAGMRQLFVELPYYTGEYLNLWIRAQDDGILDVIYSDWAGTASQNPYTLEFYKKIKRQCPQTIFHGTDVGHQYDTTGKRYLKYLEDNNLGASSQYTLTKEAIEQGVYYYQKKADVYRENAMVQNFIRELNRLGDADVMGIYGAAHTGLPSLDMTGSVPCMANQVKALYGDSIHSEDLSHIAKEMDPIRLDKITVSGKEYIAPYFGRQDLKGFKDFTYRDFWRLEGAYEDLKDKVKTGDMLPYNNYPMTIATRQVFVIDYGMKDGTLRRMYYRSDGKIWNGAPATENISVD